MPNVLNSALPPQRLRPDTRLEHQDPVRHMAETEREKKRKKKKFTKKRIFKITIKKKKTKTKPINKSTSDDNAKNYTTVNIKIRNKSAIHSRPQVYSCSQSPPPQFWDDSLSIQVFHRCRVPQVDCGDLIHCS